MMTPAGWIRSGAVSGVECTVRQFGPAFRWNSRRDWIGRHGKELESWNQAAVDDQQTRAGHCCSISLLPK